MYSNQQKVRAIAFVACAHRTLALMIVLHIRGTELVDIHSALIAKEYPCQSKNEFSEISVIVVRETHDGNRVWL